MDGDLWKWLRGCNLHLKEAESVRILEGNHIDQERK